MTLDQAQEILCEFMEGRDPRNAVSVKRGTKVLDIDSLHWWIARWRAGNWEFAPRTLDLDALHEIEERLTDEQWIAYVDALIAIMPQRLPRKGEIVHATAEQKIMALAETLGGK